MIKTGQKLSLSRETTRNLSERALAQAGGVWFKTVFCATGQVLCPKPDPGDGSDNSCYQSPSWVRSARCV